MSGVSVDVRQGRIWRGALGERRLVLDGLDLSVGSGEAVALVGPNGAGKTTLLLALVGATPFEGSISFDGVPLGRSNLEAHRAETGFVFADPSDQLFMGTVDEEVSFGPEQRGLTTKEIRRRVSTALAQVGLAGLEARAPHRLSLGERRRLAIATALAVRPRLMLIDEPTASLDPRARRSVLEALRSIGATLLVATHDLEAALELEARVVLLTEGRVVGDGPAKVVLSDPSSIEAAGLLPPASIAGRGGV